MKVDALFTSVKYECQSLYCGLKEADGWYSWKEFKEKHHPLDKSVLVEYINKSNSSGRLRIDNFNHFEYEEDLKFRMVYED
jgi:hypothetical protein